MRVLALDYGSARCGCALSDPTGTIVTPIEAVATPGSRRGLAAILQLVAEREKVRGVMKTEIATVAEDTPLSDIAKLFIAKSIKRAPVLRDGKLVGVVSRADLVQALAQS